MVPKCWGPGYPPTKLSPSVSPVHTQTGDGPCACTARPRVCKHPRGCEGAVRAHLQACMSPPATAAAEARPHCSHMQVHIPSCAHAHRFVHVRASPSSLGTCSHRATRGWSLGSPQSWCHPPGWVCTHAHAHTRVCAQACHHPPSSRGKSSPRTGAPTPQLLGDSET